MIEKKKLKELFEEVKNSYYRPPISGPLIMEEKTLASGTGTAFWNWLTFQVAINVPFVESISGQGKLEDIVKGIYTHEFGHYFFHPYSQSMKLYLSYLAQKDLNEKAEIIYQLFVDFNDNILVADEGLHKNELKAFLTAIWKNFKNPVNAAIFSAYNEKIDFGIAIDLNEFKEKEEIKKAIEDLRKISVRSCADLNYGLHYSQMLRFSKAIEPLIKNLPNSQYGGQKVGGSKLIKPEDIKNLPQDLKQKVEAEIKKLIKHLPKCQYENIRKHFLGKEEKDLAKHGLGIGFEVSSSELAGKDTINYYRDAAKEFGLYIRPKRTLTLSSAFIPFGKKEFKPTDPPLGIDLRFSGGKILPGLTQTAKKERIPFPATKDIIPGLVLRKDASGSMVKPSESKCYGTIAGAIFILSYKRSGANVDIALFDSETGAVCSSQNEDELLAMLCGYKGGGTAFDIERLKQDLELKKYSLPLDMNLNIEELKRDPLFRKYLAKDARMTGFGKLDKKQMADFVIITDGGIANLEELLAFFKDNQHYRPTILHTGGFAINVPGYDQKTSGVYEGVSILKAETKEDIIEMTKKTVRKNLLSNS